MLLRLYLQVCFTRQTYYLSDETENVPKDDLGKAYINYYQWVALGLILQAALFYMPRFLWSMLNKKSGIAVSTITGRYLMRHSVITGRWFMCGV